VSASEKPFVQNNRCARAGANTYSAACDEDKTERLLKMFEACVSISSNSATTRDLELKLNCPPYIASVANLGGIGLLSTVSSIKSPNIDEYNSDNKRCFNPKNRNQGKGTDRLKSESSKKKISEYRQEEISIQTEDKILNLNYSFLVAQIASAFGDLEIITEILKEHGKEVVNFKGPNGWSILHEAARGGDIKIVKFLVEQYGANINVTTATDIFCDGMDFTNKNGMVGNTLTAKELATEIFGNSKADQYELSYSVKGRKYPGYAINNMILDSVRRNKDSSSNQMAKSFGMKSCSIDKATKNHISNENPLSLKNRFFRAALYGDVHDLKNILGEDGRNGVVDESLLNEIDNDGWTVLHLSIMAGCEGCVKLLLNAGVNPLIRTYRGKPWTALALSLAFNGSNHQVHKYLLRKSGLSKSRDLDYSTRGKVKLPSHYSRLARFSLTEFEEAFGSNKQILHRSDRNGWTMLHEASRAGKIDIVRYLVWNGVDINKRTSYQLGGSALWIARKSHGDKHEVVKFLESIGASEIEPIEPLREIVQEVKQLKQIHTDFEIHSRIDTSDAAVIGDTQMLKKLLKHNDFDVNKADVNGWTMLHEAARAGQEETIALLVSNGANSDLVSSSGTALDIAENFHERNHTVVKFLQAIARNE